MIMTNVIVKTSASRLCAYITNSAKNGAYEGCYKTILRNLPSKRTGHVKRTLDYWPLPNHFPRTWKPK